MIQWLLLILTMVATVAFLIVVARYVIAITAVVEHFGADPDSDLAKIDWGVRAIDKETAILPGGVAQLNADLAAIRDGLMSIDRNLVVAVTSQE